MSKNIKKRNNIFPQYGYMSNIKPESPAPKLNFRFKSFIRNFTTTRFILNSAKKNKKEEVELSKFSQYAI